MRETVHKLFWLWDFDKEEKWLSEMAAKGFALVGVGFCTYHFEKSTPGEYEIRLQLLENLPSHSESRKYIEFVEETGAEHIGSFKKWVYFRKKKATGHFELYSDYPSRIKQLNRILALLIPLSLLVLGIGIINISLLKWGNIIIGSMDTLLGLLMLLGVAKIMTKRKVLQKEKSLYE